MNNDRLNWISGDTEFFADCRIFKIEKVNRISPDGKKSAFFRLNSPDWVTIVPLVENPAVGPGRRMFLTVKQFRHGSGRLSLEFPAGMIDKGETPLQAAERELLEETGYRGNLIHIGDSNPNPAFMSNRTHTFLAADAVFVREQTPDAHEFIETELMEPDELDDLIGRPPFDSAIMIQAYFWYLRYLKKGK